MDKMASIASDSGLMGKCAKRQKTLKSKNCQLPDEILVHILSFVTLKEAARTSVLSKRWMDVWMYVARLNFDGSEVLKKMMIRTCNFEKHDSFRKRERHRYVEWVKKVLQSHKCLALDECIG